VSVPTNASRGCLNHALAAVQTSQPRIVVSHAGAWRLRHAAFSSNSAFTLGRKSLDISSDLSTDMCVGVKALGHVCGDRVFMSPALSAFSTCNDVTLCV